MPEGFTAAFSKRLNDSSNLSVKEAEDGDDVFDGGGLCAAGQGGVDVGPEVVEGVGHGCSPFVCGICCAG